MAITASALSNTIKFGRNGCSTIEVEPFTPICAHPEIGGSSPMSINIPVPSFVPVIPPEDCVCFEFAKGTATASVSTACTPGSASFALNIRPSADCCSGRYTIEPTLSLSVPCVPFTPTAASTGDGTIKISNTSGKNARGIDGNVKALGLKASCCEVQPSIDIVLPDCLKGYDASKLPDNQITYCERSVDGKTTVQKTHKLISMVQDPTNCSLYPQVHKLTLPCCSQPDWEWSETKNLGGGGQITLKLWVKECTPSASLTVTPVNMPTPAGTFCLSNSNAENVTIKYIDKDGTEQTITNAGALKLTVEDGDGGCKKYKPSLSLDLGSLDVGSGITNGASVFQTEDGELYIDGDYDKNKTTWYGGGVGNLTVNTQANTVYCRGPLMRNNHLVNTAYENLKVPYDEHTGSFNLTTANGSASTQLWYSTRPTNDYEVDTDTSGNHQYGNLSMILPSGFQWHERGIAMTLSHFFWNADGVLSYLEEAPAMALVAPPPCIWATESSLGNRSGKNASGLAIDVDTNIEAGLRVNDGDGLRIFGRDSRTTSAELGETGASTKLGQLEVYAHDGDFAFVSGKLVMNDKAELTSNNRLDELWVGQYTTAPIPVFARDKDCCVPVIAPLYTVGLADNNLKPPATSNYWGTDNLGVWRPRTKTMRARATNTELYGSAADAVHLYKDDFTVETDTTYTIQHYINALKTALNSLDTYAPIKNMLQNQVVPALETIQAALASVGYSANLSAQTMNTFGIAHLHFARAGVLMRVDNNLTLDSLFNLDGVADSDIPRRVTS